ncbi:MAG TPA: aminopeptidase [Ktedonobacteraceae bacterium]|nr:aminopeptidase [Ktedonobacteraceae bacterium]
MTDPRIQRMAHVLVCYSLHVQPEERLAIRAEPVAISLIREVVREALRVGAYPEIFPILPGMKELLLKEGSQAQLSALPSTESLIAEEYETVLDISSQENTKDLNAIDPSRLIFYNQARKEVVQTFRRRSNEGLLRRSLTLYPTNAYAQDASMSLSDFEDLLYHGCFVDDENPIHCWQALSQKQERLIQWLHGKRNVRIIGQDTDLRLSIDGRLFLNDAGHYNFPGGEFFTGPVENSASGYVRYTFPASLNGYTVEDIRLRFEDGVVIEAHAAQGQAFLEKMLSLDAGSCRLGEFAFGNNDHLDRCTGNILLDEKIGGTFHLALGASFPATGGVNQSLLHWDMICDLRTGGEVWVDDELFCKNGMFVV